MKNNSYERNYLRSKHMKNTKVCSTTSNPACVEWSTLWFFFSREISFVFLSWEMTINWETNMGLDHAITHPAAGFDPAIPPSRHPFQTSIFIIPIPPDQRWSNTPQVSSFQVQREWKQRKQKCWWVSRMHFATQTDKRKSKNTKRHKSFIDYLRIRPAARKATGQ